MINRPLDGSKQLPTNLAFTADNGKFLRRYFHSIPTKDRA